MIPWADVRLARARFGTRSAELEHRPECGRPWLLRCYDGNLERHSDMFKCINSAKAVARAWLLAGVAKGDDDETA